MRSAKPITPRTTFLSIAVFGFMCFLLSRSIPSDGWNIAGMKFHFKTWDSFLHPEPHRTIEDVGAYLATLDSLDSDSLAVDTSDGTHSVQVLRTQTHTSLQFHDNDSSPLFSFFEALEDSKHSGSQIHVLHYGDSQIESDRMTGYLREKLQIEFGGYGPGLECALPVAPTAGISQSQGGNWKRYSAYGFDNGKSSHARYGIMASYSRFTPPPAPGENPSPDTTEAWLSFRPSSMAHTRSRTYTHVALFAGNNQRDCRLLVYVSDSLVQTETMVAGSAIVRYDWLFDTTPKELKLVFRGIDSPDIEALLFEGAGGLQVDNISLRGSNGNIFKRIGSEEISSQAASLGVELILLQFGGNSVPYFKSKTDVNNYAQFFQAQIQYLKKLIPGAAFVVIGPSDMSTSVDGIYQSWPFIEDVRDAMKEAAFDEGCGFWDMYEVMGGKDSMVSWVSNDPPYAGTDYTHFTPLGARKMAELLHKALYAEYEAWKKIKTAS